MKLWEKGKSLNEKIEQFTVGNDREIDLHIAKYDVIASVAHAKMLQKIGILTKTELDQVVRELNLLEDQIAEGKFHIGNEFEDVHSKIEFELTEKLGEVGKKIHTARSRNDQVLVALQLYYKAEIGAIRNKVSTLFEVLLDLAELHKEALLPGYTHLQVAMPSSFGLWFSAYAEMLIDAIYTLDAVAKIVDQNPLGSAAGYGSSFPIDREFTTELLGFSNLKVNVVAAQLGRGNNERALANAIGSIANTVGRFAMDVCLYNSQNFGFISFPDELTTGSSIMPHKKNPDVFELIRGKCNSVQSLYSEILLLTQNLPSGYHRDFQLLKEPVIKAVDDLKDILDITSFAIQQVKINKIDLNEYLYRNMFTVDSINDLVVKGHSFREAYQIIGKEVEEESFTPDLTKHHTHIGSMHNLGLDEIRSKFPKA